MSRENFKRHEESTNNVPLRFDFAHRITRWRGDTFDNNSTSRNMFGREFLGNSWKHKVIRIVSSLEQIINDQKK